MTAPKSPARPLVPAELALARTIRQLRRAPEWSQEYLAARMAERGWPWHGTTVVKIEKGRQPLRAGEVADLADIFGVTVAEMLGETRPALRAASREGAA